MTTERTHLSIGEVLSLLQPEFPDITISKIRFLESQGLLDPERTPSGYRKFHEEDIERLRWILTQQRDHFLPLKVIKDRLAAGDFTSGAPEGVLPLASESSNGGGPTPADPADPPDPLDSGPVASEAVMAAVEGISVDLEAEAADAEAAEAQASAAGAEPVAASGHDRADAVAHLVEGPDSGAADDDPPAEAEAADAEPTPPPRSGRRRHPTGHQTGAPTPDSEADPEGSAAEGEKPSVSFTLEELIAGSGMSSRDITELERYGLIAGETDDQVTTYDEEALVVARLAAGFSRYGIEPRHLRMYKVAAEREAGLFEQLITPLLKQRRSSARQQAVDMLEDLAELADDLRAAMVRSALREYLGGA
ncbi:MAG TPA: MerR family transcriptional regulator [Acidimicrobiales bacterium]